jgi:hypothetical protein
MRAGWRTWENGHKRYSAEEEETAWSFGAAEGGHLAWVGENNQSR